MEKELTVAELAARDAALRKQRELQQHKEQVRKFAVEDVANGGNVVGVAAMWGVDRKTLEKWIDQAAGD